MTKVVTAVSSGTIKYFGLERDGSGKVQHYRGYAEDLTPYLQRTAFLASIERPKGSEIRYIGSIPRIWIQDQLTRLGKTWNDYACDRDLHDKVVGIWKSLAKKFTADYYRKRKPHGPSLGSKILGSWRAENAA